MKPTIATPADRAPASRSLAGWSYALALVSIVVALGASGALAWQHITGRALPGCGGVRAEAPGVSVGSAPEKPPSACATLEAHPMGSLGGMKTWFDGWTAGRAPQKILPDQAFWPVSYLGAAWFAALLGAWLTIGARGCVVPRVLRAAVWLGALGSLGYMFVIVLSSKFCQYCITAHAGNFALLAFMEVGMLNRFTRPSVPAAPRRIVPIGVGLAAFVLTTGGLALAEHRRAGEISAAHEREFADSSAALMEKLEQEKVAAQTQPPKADTPPWGNNGFTGRWLLGPREARVRVVMLTDYQCPDCKRNEGEAMAMQQKYADRLSISAMHFPLCTDCNKGATTNMHPNACWAARAAEAAGLMGGNDGFWKMHRWLFEQGGMFTNDELIAGVKGMGFDPTAFLTIMQTDATLRPVQADIEIGDALGLYFTPLIFINGVEFRAFAVPGALTRAIEAAIAVNPPPQGPTADRPMLAREKYVADWREMPVLQVPAGRDTRTIGAPGAKAMITVFGDYTEPNTARVDSLIRSWQDKKDLDFSYTFRHYPGDKECNPSLPKTFFPMGCATAKGAEAAGNIAGEDGFWKMHTWLFKNRPRLLSAAAVREGGASVGIDPVKLEAAMGSAEALQAITQDVELARRLGVGTIPCIYVNGKLVQRWSREGDNVLERIVIEAASGKPAP